MKGELYACIYHDIAGSTMVNLRKNAILRLTFWAICVLFCFFAWNLVRAPCTVYLSGDATAVGATILCNGAFVGKMEQKVYSGPPSEVLERGAVFATAHVRVPRGKNTLKIQDSRGNKLAIDLDVQGEAYLAVDFEKMLIRGS